MVKKTFIEHATDNKDICCFCKKLITDGRKMICLKCWNKKG